MSDKKNTKKTAKRKAAKNISKADKLEDILDTDTSNPQAMGNNDQKEQQDSLKELEVIDGKERSSKESQISQARELEDLLGIREMNPYKTLNKDIFASNLEDMSIADMTSLAMHVGVTPTQSTNQLKKNLIKSFELYARRHNVNVPSQAQPIIDQNSPNYKKTVRLFKDI
jgi:hypothetical protein